MSPLAAYASCAIAGAALGFGGGWAAGWTVNGWRWDARLQAEVSDRERENRERAEVARQATEEQRLIDFNRLEKNANVTYADQERSKAGEQAMRDRNAAIVGLRNALDAASPARSSDPSIDTAARTGADDAGTLRAVVRECTAAYSEMVGNAVGAGIKVRGLQDYARVFK